MPYEMRMQGGKHCVFNKDTGENKGCSDSREMAVKHMRALYAVEGGATLKKDIADVLEQDCMCDACIIEDLADELDDTSTKAVWTSKYVNSLPDSSFAYVEPGCKTGGCRHFPIKDAEGNYDAAHVRNALARASQSPFGGKAKAKIEAGARALKIGDYASSKDIAGEVVQAVKEFLGLQAKPQGVMTLTKQADGRLRVMMRVSNNFKDRHGEVITEAAHKEYEAYVAETKDYPQFWLWHTPGTRWAQADLVSYDDGFLTMSGLVDAGKEYIAEGLAKLGDKIGVSHGFKYIKLGEETIDWYRSFEASPLPRDQAANVWTGYMLAKEWEMGLAEKHKKFFTSIGVPDSVITEWDSGNKDIAAALKEAGIEYKELETSNAQVATKTETTEAPAVASSEQVAVAQAAAAGSDSAVLAELQKLNARFDGLESKQKALEEKVKDSVGDVMAAAIAPGATPGYVASKEGGSPSDAESAANKQWEEELANFITGGGH